MNPDEIPLPIAIPLIIVLWTIWLTPYVRAGRGRRAVSEHYRRTGARRE